MILPFQRLLFCQLLDSEKSKIILAASGSSLYFFLAADGCFLSKWSCPPKTSGIDQQQEISQAPEALSEANSSERPGKRRKISSGGEISDSSSAEIVIENESKKPRRKKFPNVSIPAITHLIGTSEGMYVIAVTGEDKCIRVLTLSIEYGLVQISERHMPKRPSSITLTPDQSTILCADKFGDVYALPLLGKPKILKAPAETSLGELKPVAQQKLFVPSANNLTVHTKRNQQALKNQQNTKTKVAEKKSLDFDHELLLGHVSLLTDIQCVTVDLGKPSTSTRSYILTSDRDEHIRVSRGIPQAYIIEGYCLGHKEFISKLCILPWDHKTVISGGGDSYIAVWDWLSGKLIQEVELQSLLPSYNSFKAGTKESDKDGDSSSNIAVSGLWAMRTSAVDSTKPQGVVIAACEGIPALIIYSVASDGTFTHQTTLEVEGNVLDLILVEEEQSIMYSIDNVHQPGTTSTVLSTGGRPFVGSYRYFEHINQWHKKATLDKTIPSGLITATPLINEWASKQEGNMDGASNRLSALSDLLYGIEHLRKRGQDVPEEA